MPLGGSCGSPETSFVFGECAVSVVPSAAICIDDISVVPGECGASLIPNEGTGTSSPPAETGTTTVGEPGFPPVPPQILLASSTMYPTEAEDTILVRGWFDENNSYLHQHYSSTIYPAENIEDMVSAGSFFSAQLSEGVKFGPDYFTASSIASGGNLVNVLVSYNNWPSDYFTCSSIAAGGTLRDILLLYNEWPVEYLTSEASALSGTLIDVLLSYQNWPEEYLTSEASMVSGTMT